MAVSKTAFLSHFVATKHDHFTKTGSGQAQTLQGTVEKKGTFSQVGEIL